MAKLVRLYRLTAIEIARQLRLSVARLPNIRAPDSPAAGAQPLRVLMPHPTVMGSAMLVSTRQPHAFLRQSPANLGGGIINAPITYALDGRQFVVGAGNTMYGSAMNLAPWK